MAHIPREHIPPKEKPANVGVKEAGMEGGRKVDEGCYLGS